MSKKIQEQGSAHLVIIIILSLALLGLLGFVFFQNFMQKNTNLTVTNQISDQSSSTKTNTSDSEIALTEIAADQIAGTNLAIKYPKTWQITNTSNAIPDGPETVYAERYIITSPNNDIKINLLISNGGFGGTCEDGDWDDIQYIEKEAVPKISNAEFIEYYFSTGYFAGIHQNNKSTSPVKVGDSACKLGLSGSLMPVDNTKNIGNMALHLEMEFPEIGHDGKTSVEKFKEMIKTEDYKTAKRILKSLYVK